MNLVLSLKVQIMKMKFSIMPSRAVSDQRLQPNVVRTLSALCCYTSANGICYPNQSTLGDLIGVSRALVSRNIGSIEYERAEILMKPINIVGTSKKVQNIPIIEISACPKSNDIIGLQDLYLQLDVSNSTIDMIADNVTSGDNTSGTLYTATSSYMVGDIARLTEGEKANTSLLSSDTYVVGSSNTPQVAPQY